MRQLWVRASRQRLFLVLVALSLITLAASSPIYSAARGGHLIGHIPDSQVGAGGAAAHADCSKAAATEIVLRLHLNDPEVADPVGKVLCGSFTGPGSQTMVVSLWGPGNSGWIAFAVFRWAGGAWQFLMKAPAAASITAAGSDIRQTLPIYRASDKRCCPTAGTKTRIWHWNGTRFVPSAWRRATPSKSSNNATVHLYQFTSPSHNIFCRLGDEGTAHCFSLHTPQSVSLSNDGQIDVCRGARCFGSSRVSVPTLRYGMQDVYGGYRCRSQRVGVTCTVIASGKGFLINSAGVRRVGP
jgi:hypothetical protein